MKAFIDEHQFRAERSNALWVSDFTYVSAWQDFVYATFVIDIFTRRIVGWCVSRSARTEFVLEALEQALYARRPGQPDQSQRPWRAVCLDPLYRAPG